MHIGAGQRQGERDALSIDQYMELAPGLAPIRRVGAGVHSTPGGWNADGIQRGPRPIQLSLPLGVIQQDAPQAHPHAPTLPFAKAAFAGTPTSQAESQRELSPGQTPAE